MSRPAVARGQTTARGRIVRTLAASFLVALLVLLLPVAVWAHAQVVTVDPVDGARLPVSPVSVSVTFNEAPTLAPGGLRVIRPDGTLADVGGDTIDGTTVRQAIETLPAGWYVMAWSIISEDGHVVHGSATFAVGGAGDATRPAGSIFAAPLETALWLSRGLADLALLVAAGAGVAWCLLGACTGWVRRLWLGALAIGMLAQGCWLAVEIADGGGAWWTSLYALSGFARLILLGAALVLGVLRPPLVRGSLVATVLAVLTLALGGHATGSPLASLTLAIHLLAAITWLGAAPAVALVMWDRSVTDETARDTVRGFSRLATVALVVLVAGGSASALLLTNGLEGGLTVYVRIVLAKVAVVAVAALIGAQGRRGLGSADRGRYRRLFLIDAGLLVVVALLSSALTLVGPHGGHTSHGEHTVASPRCSMTVGEGTDAFGAAFIAAPGVPGINEVMVSGVPADVLGVTGELEHPYAGGAAIVVPLTATATGWMGSAVLPFTGAWTASVAVRVDTFTQARGACRFTIAP